MKTDLVIFPQPVPYPAALQLQEKLVARRQADEISDTLIFLEHTPVVTLGIRARQENLLLSTEALARRGIAVHETPRGGDVTFHGPGQLICYPIMKLSGDDADAHAFVGKLEEIAIRTASAFGVAAYRRQGKTGVWTDAGKIAAIGIRFRKWVSSHGMSFNVNVSLADFATIVPCGLHGEKVTSLAELLGSRCPPLAAVRSLMQREFATIMRQQVSSPES